MPWTLANGEDGFLLCRVTGHMADPFGVFLDQQKAEFILETLEWGEFLSGKGVVPAPPRFTPKKRRNTKKEQTG